MKLDIHYVLHLYSVQLFYYCQISAYSLEVLSCNLLQSPSELTVLELVTLNTNKSDE